MHAAEEVVHTEIGHEDGKESKYHVGVVDHGATEDRQRLSVDDDGIDHEGDERPCFLWVPTPLVSPRHIGPNGSDEDAETHRGKGRIEENAREHG